MAFSPWKLMVVIPTIWARYYEGRRNPHAMTGWRNVNQLLAVATVRGFLPLAYIAFPWVGMTT